jgi:repressor LexA
MTLGERLRKARERKGWSQLYVAQKIGISNANISNYERDYREPDVETLLNLSELYEVSLDYLLGKTDDPDAPQKINISVLNKRRQKKDESYLEDDFMPVGTLKNLPIVAEIPCGEPIFTEDNVIGYFPVDTSVIKLGGGEYVWVIAKGDSMINANIKNGDLVLIRLQDIVDSGEIAAVCVDDENATLKRVLFVEDNVILVPENPDMKPMSYHKSRIRVMGKVIRILSKPT